MKKLIGFFLLLVIIVWSCSRLSYWGVGDMGYVTLLSKKAPPLKPKNIKIYFEGKTYILDTGQYSGGEVYGEKVLVLMDSNDTYKEIQWTINFYGPFAYIHLARDTLGKDFTSIDLENLFSKSNYKFVRIKKKK